MIFKTSLSGKASYERIHKSKKIHKTSDKLERYTGKIVELGKLRKRQYLVICDGKGNFKIKDPSKWSDKLNELEKNKKLLRKEEYKKIRKAIIDEVSDSSY